MWRHMKSLSATLTQFATEESAMKDTLPPLVGTELLLRVYILGLALKPAAVYIYSTRQKKLSLYVPFNGRSVYKTGKRTDLK